MISALALVCKVSLVPVAVNCSHCEFLVLFLSSWIRVQVAEFFNLWEVAVVVIVEIVIVVVGH